MQNPEKSLNPQIWSSIKNKNKNKNKNKKKKKKTQKLPIKEKANTIKLCKTDYHSIEIGKAIIQSGCISVCLAPN